MGAQINSEWPIICVKIIGAGRNGAHSLETQRNEDSKEYISFKSVMPSGKKKNVVIATRFI